MIDKAQENRIWQMVLTEMAREHYLYAPVGVSMRHVHLSRKDLQILFGAGYELHSLRELVQPGQFAAQEQVALQGPKGQLEKVRIIGPLREETQVELSWTDAMTIGLKDIPVRLSGHLKDTPGIRIIGPAGEVTLSRGVIVAARHLHLSEAQAKAFHIHDGQVVSVRIGGERPCILERVICRAGRGHELEFHVDADEANACMLKNKDIVQILPAGQNLEEEPAKERFDPLRISEKVVFALTGRQQNRTDKSYLLTEETHTPSGEVILDLVTEQDIDIAYRQGKTQVFRAPKALITPAARDRSAELNISILSAEGNSGRSQYVSGNGAAVQSSAQADQRVREEELLELVTAAELNIAFRDNQKEIYCTQQAIITPAAKERIEETGIRVIRV